MAYTPNNPSSSIYRVGVTPQTRTFMSSRNRVKAVAAGGTAPEIIGVIGQFNPKDNRNVEPVRGIGFGDQIAELVPTASEPITISVTRTALYLANMFQVFGYLGGIDGLVRALKHHRWPFDIAQEILTSAVDIIPHKELSTSKDFGSGQVDPGGNSDSLLLGSDAKAILTFYAGCWMTGYNYTVQAETTIVNEDCEISVTDVFAGGRDLNAKIKGSDQLMKAEATSTLIRGNTAPVHANKAT